MRLVVVSGWLPGHFNPSARLALCLREMGAEVACVFVGSGADDARRRRLPDDVVVRSVYASVETAEERTRSLVDRDAAVRRLERMREQPWSPFATAIRDLAPDAVILDLFPGTYGALAWLHGAGVPYALASANVLPVAPRHIRGYRKHVDDAMLQFFARHGVPTCDAAPSARSPWLNLVPSMAEFLGDDAVLDDVMLVGMPCAPAASDEPVRVDWSRIAPDRPLVYASLGTNVYWQPAIFRSIIAAVEKAGAQVIASVGDLIDELGPVGDHVTLARSVRQSDVLARADVFVTHGGYNSVAESLRAGVPMLVMPIALDQPLQAHYVSSAQLGDALTNEATAAEIGDVLERLLDARTGHGARARAFAGRCAETNSARAMAEHIVRVFGS